MSKNDYTESCKTYKKETSKNSNVSYIIKNIKNILEISTMNLGRERQDGNVEQKIQSECLQSIFENVSLTSKIMPCDQ